MKITKITFFSAIFLCASIYSVKIAKSSNSSDGMKVNIEALSANAEVDPPAGDITCDAMDDSSCKIIIKNTDGTTSTGYGTGTARSGNSQ